MPIYEYECLGCKQKFDVAKSMAESSRPEYCQCGREAERRYTPIPFSVGWRLTDASQERFGPKDEYEKDV